MRHLFFSFSAYIYSTIETITCIGRYGITIDCNYSGNLVLCRLYSSECLSRYIKPMVSHLLPSYNTD